MISASDATAKEQQAAAADSINSIPRALAGAEVPDIPAAQSTPKSLFAKGTADDPQMPPTPDDIRRAWEVIKLSQQGK